MDWLRADFHRRVTLIFPDAVLLLDCAADTQNGFR